MRYLRDDPQWSTALQALESYDNRKLTALSRAFVGKKPPTRKNEMIAALLRLLEPDHLPELWKELTPLEQSAAAEAAWSRDGAFHADVFHAKYGEPLMEEDPGSSLMFGIRSKPRAESLLDLLQPQDVMPRDLQTRVRKFVPKPAAAKVKTTEEAPTHIDSSIYTWNEQTQKRDPGIEQVPLEQRQMQRVAPKDLLAILRLVGAGKLSVTDKNKWPTPSSMRAIADVLDGGDFYPAVKKQDDDFEDEAGPIRAFAWPMLLQAGGLAKAQGSKLVLTKDGKEALAAPPHETLRELWEAWLDNSLLDELRRINVIRGQTGGGKRYLTEPYERREAIAAALAECPLGRWVALDDFSTYMQAGGHKFEVTSDPYSLYIFEQQYGSLPEDWDILQLRYILCLIMEYAATLGLVDIAYITPDSARPNYGGLWGTDDLCFFSRYDGLQYMSVNALGRWCMGLTESYVPPPLERRNILQVRPEREVIATGPLTPADRMMLDTFGQATGPDTWELDGLKILTVASEGRKIAELTAFLESAGGAPLPNPTAIFLTDLEQRLGMFRDEGPARLLHCQSPDLATALTTDPSSAKTCYRVNEHLLAVPLHSETAFQKALRKYGFVLLPRQREASK